MFRQTSRPNDYKYDPAYIFSHEKDYMKASVAAKISIGTFAKCPIFSSMFSDLPHHPRQQLVLRETRDFFFPSHNVEIKEHPKCVDIVGVDRFRYFSSPIQNISVEQRVPTLQLATPKATAVVVGKRLKNRKIQTQYRESSAQTSPWQPPVIVMQQGDLEILKLDFLKWGSGLPAGMHEVRLIERARMKRAWEKTLPSTMDKSNMKKRRRLIEAMERDEWAFREQEIQDIQNLRLELLEQMLVELHEKSKCRTEQKLKSYCDTKQAEKEEKLKKLHHYAKRELRKLEMKEHGINKKYRAINIIDEHADKKSELYAPLIRHGEHPKRWHECLDISSEAYRAKFLGVERFGTLPRWLDEIVKTKGITASIKLPGTHLCIRETKWTSPILKQLHSELKNLRHKSARRHCSLLEKLEKEEVDICTPDIEQTDDFEEDLHQATVLIQSVLRGRASQVLIFEGRNRCRELIRELRSTHALQEADQIKKFKERLEVKSQQREHQMCLKNANKLHETLNKLSGCVVGTLLDFLNKELRRLLDERKAHAMCIVAERERYRREAAEAGRRQAEIRCRLEHDEMFKQVVKVHQDTVDLYLQDIITEGIEFTSEEESHLYIQGLAKQIDEEAYQSVNSTDQLEREEIVANMIHNFLLPNVEKEMIRENIKKKQRNYLKTVHESIYKKINHLPKIPPESPRRGRSPKEKVELQIEPSEKHLVFRSKDNIHHEYPNELDSTLTPLSIEKEDTSNNGKHSSNSEASSPCKNFYN